MTKLTWKDLIIDDFSPEEASRWLSPWSALLTGPMAPLFLSKLGDWFLRRPDGSTEMLDILDGSVSRVASTAEEFGKLVNSVEWQEEKLLSYFVYQCHEAGIVPGRGQCYGLAPHPALGGRIEPSCATVLDVFVWQSLCAQFVGKV